MVNTTTEIIKVSRPVHWIKNFALFAAIIFSGNLFVPHMLENVMIAFISFSFATSAAYVFNDILDAKQDRLHPIKKDRPIASKRLSVKNASVIVFVLVTLSFIIAASINFLFFISVA